MNPHTAPAASQPVIPAPLPFPAVTQPASFSQAQIALLLLLLCSTLLWAVWNLPHVLERRGNRTVARFGGAYAVQNSLLRGAGFLSIVCGFFLHNFLGGMLAAVLLGILVNVRWDGKGSSAVSQSDAPYADTYDDLEQE